MAINPTLVAGNIQAAAPTYSGVDWATFTLLLGTAFTSWLPSVQTQGVTVGTAGSGAVLGKLTVPPNPGVMVGAFSSGGLRGVDAATLATAIANGFTTSISQAGQYTGVSAGVGAGSDTSFVVSAPGSVLTGLILSTGQASGFRGVDIASLASAIGVGAQGLMSAATGVGAVTGAGSPTSASGTSTGTCF